MRRILVVVVVLAVLAGCGDVGGSTAPPRSSSDPSSGATSPAEDPPALKAPMVRLHLQNGAVDLKPWTACYGNGCFDGSPPKDLVDVGVTEAVEFSFARSGWSFEATFREPGDDCPRRITVPTTKVSDTRFRVEPAGNLGEWEVDVFGRGPGGDVITTFHWRTPTAGAFPDAATGTVAVLADHDGRLDSYGVELSVSDLARTPKEASATVTVLAADGQRAEIDLGPKPQERCWSAGQIFWTQPEGVARSATHLPGKVFEYVAAAPFAFSARWQSMHQPISGLEEGSSHGHQMVSGVTKTLSISCTCPWHSWQSKPFMMWARCWNWTYSGRR